MSKWNKTVLTVMLEYDYGNPKLGVSGDKLWFHKNLCDLVENVHAFWYDPYLEKKEELQKALIETANRLRPDLIFFTTYTDQFAPVTLRYLKDRYKTVAWFGDDHWRFDNYTKSYAPHFTNCITTDRLAVPKYRDLGVEPIVSEWAAEPSGTYVSPETVEKYDYDVSFVGGRNEVRSWFVRELEKRGIRVACFGGGWDNGRVSFDQMKEIFLKSKINLNLSNSVPQDVSFVFGHPMNFLRWLVSKKRFEQVKARNFEIPLAGGFQLSKYALGLESHLQIGTEVAVFNTPDECASQIAYFLANEAERKQITARSFARTWNEHTYEHRFRKILSALF